MANQLHHRADVGHRRHRLPAVGRRLLAGPSGIPRRARRAALVLAKGGRLMRYLPLFSGLEAAHLALGALGWDCVAVFEMRCRGIACPTCRTSAAYRT